MSAAGLAKHFNMSLEVEHAFSAEIVPYKQAYIERNFSPPIIFRDIRELVVQDKAYVFWPIGLAMLYGNRDLNIANIKKTAPLPLAPLSRCPAISTCLWPASRASTSRT
jgi:hypothetical protein